MDVGWIDDLIALQEQGTLARAAEARHVTQPAFSRRLAAIEQWCGAELVDRRHRPLRLRPEVLALLPEMRSTGASLQQLREDLRRSTGDGSRVIVAAQHSLSVTLLPRLYRHWSSDGGLGVLKLRSVNRAEGLILLLTGKADVLICQETARHPLDIGAVTVDRISLADDRLVPVCGHASRVAGIGAALRTGAPMDLPLISYPPEVFLGRVLRDECLSALPPGLAPSHRIETALTPAVVRFLVETDAVAWVPETLVKEHLQAGVLHRLPAGFATPRLLISAIRIRQRRTSTLAQVWEGLKTASIAQ